MPGTTFSAANWSGYDEQSVTNPGSALTDFTLLINVANLSSSFKSTVQSDGADIRLTKGDGTTELPYDLIDWAYNAGSPTGWIRVKWSGTLATSGTQNVRVYAGYTGGTAVAYDASETYGRNNAYDSSWEAYWPLHDLNDRTSNGHNLSAINTPTSGATGQVGDCYEFDQSVPEYLSLSSAIISSPPLTIMGWGRTNLGATGNNALASLGLVSTTGGHNYLIMMNTAGSPAYAFTQNGGSSEGAASTANTSDETWHHVAGVWSGSASRSVFLDGGNKGSNTNSITNPETLDRTQIANSAQGSGVPVSRNFDGRIDDVQFHSAARPDDWIAHEYDQSNDNATFWGTWAWTSTGGSSVSASLSDGVSNGDSVSCTITTSQTVLEGNSLGDSFTSLLQLLSNVSEGSIFGESISRIKSIVSSLTAGHVLSDTNINVGTLLTVTTEGSVLGDTKSNTGTFFTSTLDGHVLTDQNVVRGDLLSALSDQVVLSDSVSSGFTFTSSLSEGVLVGDSTDGTVFLTSSLTEGTTHSDVSNVTGTLLSSSTEGLSLSDVITEVATLLSNVSDGIDLGDTFVGSIGTLTVSLTEGLTLSDTNTNTLTGIVVLSEGTEFGDTFSVATGGTTIAPYYYTTLLIGRTL